MVGPASRPSPGGNTPSPRGWKLLRGLVLALLLALTLLPVTPAAALPWPGRRDPGHPAGEPPSAAPGRQEVAPPLGVQQLRSLLEGHQPRLRILTPQADSLMPAGPWTLRLELSDWPLLDADPLGLGPHLVVQLDDDPPLRLTTTSTAMPPLAPGSHRLSVFAAMPWGEAVHSPGAFAQIRLHRAAANPLVGPAPGTAQLIPVLPVVIPADQPLPLDWLLVDAPLQHLRSGDDSWRLRVSLDGDSLLLDRQEALWLQGLSPGRHPLVLELVNPGGEPLNPPYNSLVRELVASADSPLPPWLTGPMSTSQLALLSGSGLPSQSRQTGGQESDLQAGSPEPSAEPAPVPAEGWSQQPAPPEPGSDRVRASASPPPATLGSPLGQRGAGDAATALDRAVDATSSAPTAAATVSDALPARSQPIAVEAQSALRESPAVTPDANADDQRQDKGPTPDAAAAPPAPAAAPATAQGWTPNQPVAAPPTAAALDLGQRDGERDASGTDDVETTNPANNPADSVDPRPAARSDEPRRATGDAPSSDETAPTAVASAAAEPPASFPEPPDNRPPPRQPPPLTEDPEASATDAPPASTARSQPGETAEDTSTAGSRNLTATAPSPSLTPRPSTPEPFDPWSPLLLPQPSASPGRSVDRSPVSGLLDRLRQLSGR